MPTIRKPAGDKGTPQTFEINVPSVHLSSDSEPLRFRIKVEKIPTEIKEGERLLNVIVDTDNEKLRPLLEQARELRNTPEEERPRAILELLSKNMKYAYDYRVEDLSETNPESAAWVTKHIGLHCRTDTEVKLSDLIKNGYGVCRHFSAAMLVLAKEAGMGGVLMTNSGKGSNNPKTFITNIIRKDTLEPLFKLANVGGQLDHGHAWVEIKTSNGWIPVEPCS